MLCSDTFPTMPIKHLRRSCFVTHSKITICYPLIITVKQIGVENFHHTLLESEISTIERKMSHTESECRIKLDKNIA